MKAPIKVFIHYRKYNWKDEPDYVAWPYVMDSTPESVFILEHEFDVDIPDDFDPTPKQIEMLRTEKSKILAEAQVKANNIDAQIQELLCIEHKVPV